MGVLQGQVAILQGQMTIVQGQITDLQRRMDRLERSVDELKATVGDLLFIVRRRYTHYNDENCSDELMFCILSTFFVCVYNFSVFCLIYVSTLSIKSKTRYNGSVK